MLLRLEKVLQKLKKGCLTLKLSKCIFGTDEFEFLGFRIRENKILPGERKVLAIKAFPTPKNEHDIRSFLGLAGFFRRFIRNFASISEPLSRLTQKQTEFKWTDEQESAFQKIKDLLTSEPVLGIYNPKARTEIHTDASSKGIGGMLLQEAEDGKMHLIYCVSRATNDSERTYHSSKLELIAIVWTLQRLRPLLIGIEFVVYTDCQALMYLQAQKTTNPQIARWYSLLQEYQMDIRHRSGKNMQHVDALSRYPVEANEDTMDKAISDRVEIFMAVTQDDFVAMMQQDDVDMKELTQILLKDENSRSPTEKNRVQSLELYEGKIYRIVDGRRVFVVPKHMRKALVVNYHDLLGHFGISRTMAAIKRNFWFSNMKRYVRHHIATCLTCLITKGRYGKEVGKLNPIPAGTIPFQVVHADHIGPFPRSSKGNSYILTTIDNLTKFVHLYPVKSTDAQNVIKSLKSLILDRGKMERLISDRGSAFTSEAVERFCEREAIKHILNSTAHARANGQVERVHRTLVPVMMSYIKKEDQTDWDANIQAVQRDLNVSINSTTGRSPFELLHGYVPQFNDAATLVQMVEHDQNTRRKDPADLREEAKVKIREKQSKMAEYFNQTKISAPKYQVGNIVFMETRSHGEGISKLKPKYRGPLTITAVLPADTYRVMDLIRKPGKLYVTTAHVSQLKFWKTVYEDDGYNSEDNVSNPDSNFDDSNSEFLGTAAGDSQADDSPSDGEHVEDSDSDVDEGDVDGGDVDVTLNAGRNRRNKPKRLDTDFVYY